MDPLWHTNRRWHVIMWAFYLILKLMFWIFILKSMFSFGKTPWRDGQVPINRQVDSIQLIFVKCCFIEKIGLQKKKQTKKTLWLLAINKPEIFHTRPSTCKYYLHSSLTLSILMCTPLQPRQRGAPSTARSPGRCGVGVGGPEDDESLSSISPSFWSPEPLAEGLILFHVSLTTLLRRIDYEELHVFDMYIFMRLDICKTAMTPSPQSRK